MIRSLLWKEWREQRWKMAFGSIVLMSFALIGLRARMIPDDALVLSVCLIGAGVLPVLTAMGLIPPERHEGSMSMLLALPVRPLWIVTTKLLIGALACIVPMLGAMAVSLLVAGGREMASGDMAMLHLRATATIVSLLVWIVALSVRLPTEARAGLIGLGVLVFWSIATLGLLQAHGQGMFLLWLISPTAFLVPARELLITRWAAVLVQALLAFALWKYTTWQLAVDDGGGQ